MLLWPTGEGLIQMEGSLVAAIEPSDCLEGELCSILPIPLL